MSDLRSRAATTGSGSLLDLGCGPGRVAIPMARYFNDVLAVDVESEMIEAGRDEADRCGATNIVWRVTRAEDLDRPAHSVDLITIGDAFHRLDQPRILTRACEWLRPGGSLTTLGSDPVWRGPEPWKRILVEVVDRWSAVQLGDPDQVAPFGYGDVLRAAGLTVEERESVVERTWTCDEVVGFMYSTSIASRRALGHKASDFEAALRAALLEAEPSGQFASMQRFGFTLGRQA